MLRVQGRVPDVLNVGCDGDLVRDLQAIEQLNAALIIEPRLESVLIGLPPVEAETPTPFLPENQITGIMAI